MPDILNQLQIGSLVYVAEGPQTDRPDMRVEPGRLHSIETLEAAGPLEPHAVIVRPCRDPGGEHPLEHHIHCKRAYNSDLIRSAGEIITGARGKAIVQYSYGRHETPEFVAISEKGLVLLCVDPTKQRYEWRFPPEPLPGGAGRRDRVQLTADGNARAGDFVVQNFSIMFNTISPRTEWVDIEGRAVSFPFYSQVADDFQGDSALIRDWEAACQAHC